MQDSGFHDPPAWSGEEIVQAAAEDGMGRLRSETAELSEIRRFEQLEAGRPRDRVEIATEHKRPRRGAQEIDARRLEIVQVGRVVHVTIGVALVAAHGEPVLVCHSRRS